jgi:hypothetical protein
MDSNHGLVTDLRRIVWRLQPLVCNGQINNGVIEPVSRQRIGKHVPAATVKRSTMEKVCCLHGPRRRVKKK